jgi:hypothetical protein
MSAPLHLRRWGWHDRWRWRLIKLFWRMRARLTRPRRKRLFVSPQPLTKGASIMETAAPGRRVRLVLAVNHSGALQRTSRSFGPSLEAGLVEAGYTLVGGPESQWSIWRGKDSSGGLAWALTSETNSTLQAVVLFEGDQSSLENVKQFLIRCGNTAQLLPYEPGIQIWMRTGEAI